MFDVVISGAGPAGLHTAKCCEKAGLDVLVLEEHTEIGSPCHCSGLVSSNLRNLVPVKKDFVEHTVRGATIHSPDGKQLKLEKPGTAAYVINRTKFDCFLASRLESEIKLGTPVTGIEIKEDKAIVRSGRRKFESRALVGCDGSGSFTARTIDSVPKEILTGIIAITKGSRETNSSGFVDIWFDKNVCDGFLWRIPRGNSTEYGMLGTGIKSGQMGGFFGLEPGYKKYGGTVPIGPPKTYSSRILLAARIRK